MASRPCVNDHWFIVREDVDDLEKVKWLWQNRGLWMRWSTGMYPTSARLLHGETFEHWRGGCGTSDRGLWVRYVGWKGGEAMLTTQTDVA